MSTDCSGIEAAIIALQQAQQEGVPIRFRHLASCDNDSEVQRWITQHHRPSYLFSDLLQRDWADGGKGYNILSQSWQAWPCPDVLVTGFPCTPFSTLHTNTGLFSEPAAAPFTATMATIRASRPGLVVLENVQGILRARAQERLHKELESLGAVGYKVVVVSGLGPDMFNHPIKRPRVYIVAVRADKAKSSFRRVFLTLLGALKRPLTATFLDVLARAAGGQQPPACDAPVELCGCCSSQQVCNRPASNRN